MKRYLVPVCTAVLVLCCVGGGFAAVKETLVVANVADPKTLDPQSNGDLLSTVILRQLYDTLLMLDEEGRVVPHLAERWEASDDKQYFTFHIRKGVHFHDGSELTAKDVASSFRRCIKQAMANYVTANVDPNGIEVIDDYTIRVRTKVPDTGFPYYLTSPNGMGITSEKAVSAPGANPDMKPIGSGPYKFVSWQKGNRLELARNDDYWGKKAITPRVVFRVITEPANRTIDLETGQVDLVLAVQYIDIEQVKGNPKLKLVRVPRPLYTFIGMNTKLKPFDDVRVRQALAMSLDLDRIVQVVYRGVGTPNTSIIPPMLPYYTPDQPKHEYNPEKAKKLMAEAGYPNGFKAFFGVSDRKERVDTAQVAQYMWKETLGMEIEIQVMEQGAFVDYMGSDKCSLHIASWSNVMWEPVSSAAAVLEIGSTNNYSRFDDPLYNELLQKARMTPDGPERAEVFKQIQVRYRELLPIILTWTGEDVVAFRANLEGFRPLPIYDVSEMYIKQ